MTHTQWRSKLRQSLAQVDHQPARALRSMDALVRRIHAEGKTYAGDWHIEQTLEALSTVHSHLDDHRRSAETMLQLAERHETELTYHRRAFVSACATAALELASAGDRDAAARALRRASPIAARVRPADKLFRRAQKVVSGMGRGR